MAHLAFVGVPKDPLFTIATAPVPVGITLSIDVTGLPPGLTYNDVTKTVGGTPTAAGYYTATITVTPSDPLVVPVASIETTIDVLLNLRVTVSGTIKDESDNPLSGVTVTESATNTNTTTALDGTYSLLVPYDVANVSITPSTTDKRFIPASIVVSTLHDDIPGQDFVAAAVTVPGIPTITGITSGNGTLIIAFSLADNGGRAVTNYSYSLNNGSTWTLRAPASGTSPLTVTGLTNGSSYQVKIKAINSIGTGLPSSAQQATVYYHLYPYGSYWGDYQPIDNGQTLYTTQTSGTPAANHTFTLGLFTIITDPYGVVTKSYTYNTQYPHGRYYSDDQTLVDGVSYLYTEQYGSVKATNVSTFNEDLRTVHTDTNGLVILGWRYNHLYPYGSYYGDNATLNTGNTLYMTEHETTVAASKQFELDGYNIVTNSSGIVTKTAINHVYGYTLYHYDPIPPIDNNRLWSDSYPLTLGNHIYAAQHSNDVTPFAEYVIYSALNIIFLTGGVVTFVGVVSPGGLYKHSAYWSPDEILAINSLVYTGSGSGYTLVGAITFTDGSQIGVSSVIQTDGAGLVTSITPTYNHPNPHGSYWSDYVELYVGDTLYTAQNNNTPIGVQSFQDAQYTITTDASGVVLTKTLTLDHSHAHGVYWSDTVTLELGDLLYTSRYLNDLAISKTFVEGLYTIITNTSGHVSSKEFTYNHAYPYGAYYSSDSPLSNASILYTGQNVNTVAASVKFELDGYTINTDASGAVTKTFIDHMYMHDIYWGDFKSLETGYVLFTGRHTNTLAATVTFNARIGDYVYTITTGSNGVVTKNYLYNHSYTFGSYFADTAMLTTGGSLLYVAQHTQVLAVNVAAFDLGEYTISTNAGGVVTYVRIDHQYPHNNNTYWSDDLTLDNGSILYVGQHTNEVVAGADFEEDDYRITTDGSGVVTRVYIDHQYPHGNYWADNESLFTWHYDGYSMDVWDVVVLYTGQHTNTLAANITPFEEYNAASNNVENVPHDPSGYMIGTDEYGTVARTYIYHPYYYDTFQVYWGDSAEISSVVTLYTGAHTNVTTAAGNYEIAGYVVVVGANGAVTSTDPINYPYSHGIYWSDDSTLLNGSYLYVSKILGAGVAANITPFDGGYGYMVSTDGAGLVTLTPV